MILVDVFVFVEHVLSSVLHFFPNQVKMNVLDRNLFTNDCLVDMSDLRKTLIKRQLK